MLLKLGKT